MRDNGYSDRIFCYGTLEFPELMRAVTGRRYAHQNAVLRDHARYLVRGEVYPGVVAQPGADVPGVVYQRVRPGELQLLDRYESDFYCRRLLDVESDLGETVRAWVYVVPESMRALLGDRPWNRDLFARRHLRAWLKSLGDREAGGESEG